MLLTVVVDRRDPVVRAVADEVLPGGALQRAHDLGR
jgi:hypothetical protein